MTMTETVFKYVESGEQVRPPQGGHAACPGCGAILAMRYFLKALGEKVILVMPPGCAAVVITRPQPSVSVHRFWVPFMTAASIAGGLSSALRARGDRETTVVAWGGDGATFDIGLACLSAAAERNEDLIYVCYDNEAYMNTGNQKSSATPLGSKTATNPPPTTKVELKKDIMKIMMAHDIPYAATASIAYPDDFMKKVVKAKNMTGFRFFHILTPCPTGWFYRAERTIELARLAVETKLFPLFEIENGIKLCINREPSGISLEEYIKPQGRFSHLTPEQLANLKEGAERRWQQLKLLANFSTTWEKEAQRHR